MKIWKKLQTQKKFLYYFNWHYYICPNICFPHICGLEQLLWMTSKKSIYVSSFWIFYYFNSLFSRLSFSLSTTNFRHLLGLYFHSIFSKWPNYGNLRFYKHSLMVLNFNFFIGSAAEIMSWGVTLHIHVNIYSSFLDCCYSDVV